uniref:ABC transporter ATP-binding protein n=1 Tax=Agathobacter sp. TaxID=2021311 RepID=UPI00405656C5
MRSIFTFFTKYIKRNWLFFSIYMFLCMLCAIFSLVSPYISGNFIDALLRMENYGELIRYCMVFAILSIGAILSNFFLNQIFTSLKIKISYEMNMDFLYHMRKVSLLRLQEQSSASITQKLNYDTGIVTGFSLQTLQNFIINMIVMLFPLAALLHFSLIIGIILIFLVLIYLFTYIAFKKPLYKYNQEAREKETAYFNSLYKQIGYVKFVKMNSIGDFFDKLMRKSFIGLYKSGMYVQRVGYLFTSLDKIILTIAQIVLFFLGGIQVIKGKLTIGQFTVISTYFSMILGSIRYFFGLGKSIQEVQVSLERLCNIMEIEEEKYGKEIIKSIHKVELKNVNFKFVTQSQPILDRFSYKFLRGKIYAIIGENGTGKSTLLNLITGMYQVSEESIFIEDIPIEKCDLKEMRLNNFGILEQEPILLEDSIKNNLFLGSKDKSKDEKFIKLIRLLGLSEFFQRLPNGMETVINEKALNLSGGEKQKLSLFRILLKDSDLLILDEPTSAMDIGSRENLYSYLNDIKLNKIIIVITHDSQIIDKVDQVITLSKNT